MRILIIGSGATGGFIGVRLIEKKCHATFLVRPERKVQLVTRGLILSSPFGRFRRAVAAITPEEIDGRYDIVIVAVRAQDLETVLEVSAPAVGPNTIVLPVVEGMSQFEIGSRIGGPRTIGCVFEGRITLDADGFLRQAPPASELHIGALHNSDAAIADGLLSVLAGRGLTTVPSNQIRSIAWERFSFVCAAIATSVLTRRPLRDAVRFAYGPATYVRALKEGARIGQAAGFHPDSVRVRAYARSFTLIGRPVQPPARVVDGGRAGDEAACLLGEMIGFANRHGVNAYELASAWKAITRHSEVAMRADEGTVAPVGGR